MPEFTQVAFDVSDPDYLVTCIRKGRMIRYRVRGDSAWLPLPTQGRQWEPSEFAILQDQGLRFQEVVEVDLDQEVLDLRSLAKTLP